MGCGQSKKESKLTKVVIVGGGFSGTYLACLLQQQDFCKVTLIDPKEVFVHKDAIPRSIVEPEILDAILILYRNFINNYEQGSVTSINLKKNVVLLENKKKIPYDYLVISSGMHYNFPFSVFKNPRAVTADGATNLYKELNSEMKRSPEIVLIGGNEFAVELAGEIRADYPDKKVTIIHSGTNLISDDMSDQFQATLKEELDRKEVDLRLNVKVENESSLEINGFKKEQTVKMNSGKDIPADLVVKCESTGYNTRFCSDSLPESSLDFTGAINVDEQLKVQGCSNIYAVGGATNLKSRKHFENSKLQADVVASNIKASLNQEVFRTFKPASCPTLVTIGRYGGVGYEDGSLLDEDKVMERKSEDVFIKRVWKDFGLVFPGAMNPAYDVDSTSTSVTSS